jgi:teichuronic acid biosynthesis glycosyltransferase TuaC
MTAVELRRTLRVLAVTRIFPNRLEPLAATYQRQQLAALSRFADVEVLAVVPSLFGASLFGDRSRAGRLAKLPEEETIDGLHVTHPRARYVPGVASLPALAPVNMPLYVADVLPHARRLAGKFDVVLGAWLYPDACAAAKVARALGVPYVVKTHGSDVNVVSAWTSIHPILRDTLAGAAWSLGVSRPLVDRLIELGAPRDRAALLPNGVDRDLFHPRDRVAARAELGLPSRGKIVLFVGRVEREKGVRELHDAFERLEATRGEGEPVHLVFVGFGALEHELTAVAARNAAHAASRPNAARLFAMGGESPERVATFLAACDVLALPSWLEGTPNVVLEALAAGRPCVATAVGGIPGILEHGKTGLLTAPRDVPGLVDALRAALSRTWDEATLVAAAPASWAESAARLHTLLAQAATTRHVEAA